MTVFKLHNSIHRRVHHAAVGLKCLVCGQSPKTQTSRQELGALNRSDLSSLVAGIDVLNLTLAACF